MLTLHDVCEKLKRLDELTLLEVLDITSEELVEKFEEEIEEHFEELIKELEGL